MDTLISSNGKQYTRSLAPGIRVYGERLHTFEDQEYREWSPTRSKLSAYLTLGGKEMPIKNNSRVLYLGAASGTTASHISDLVPNGIVYCVEFSPRSFRDLVRTCENRKNMVPLLGDATIPDSFAFAVDSVDIVYQDVAQKRQHDILANNMERFSADTGMIAVKSRSEDVTATPEAIFERTCNELRSRGLRILDMRPLDPFEKDHAMIIVRR
jgi:Fibrillarin-like rRNA methylase